MIKLKVGLGLLAASFMVKTAMSAATPILCPQTIQAFCQLTTHSGVACSLASHPQKHFDVHFVNPDQHTGLVTLYFQKAHMVDLDALCEYKSATTLQGTLSNKDNDGLEEDADFPGNQWQETSVHAECHGPEAIYCPFKSRY
jgi:hypothetical protein